MNSGRIAIGTFIIGVIVAALLLGTTQAPTGYSANWENQTIPVSVVVNGAVSITLFNVPIQFSGSDPGTTSNPATVGNGYPMTVQVDGATNVNVDVYVNGSDFSLSGGGGSFLGENMSWNASKPTQAPLSGTLNTTCIAAGNCRYKEAYGWAFNDTARNGAPENATIYNWIDIPSVPPGTYLGNVTVCADQVLTSGCV